MKHINILLSSLNKQLFHPNWYPLSEPMLTQIHVNIWYHNILTLKTNFSEILIEIHTFPVTKNAFENVVCKMAVNLSRPHCVNSLAPGGFENIFQNVFFKLISWIDTLSNSCETALRSMPQNPSDDKSTLVQVMAWCRQAASHYLSQCCPRSLSPYGVSRPQWVKTRAGASTTRVLVLPKMINMNILKTLYSSTTRVLIFQYSYSYVEYSPQPWLRQNNTKLI